MRDSLPSPDRAALEGLLPRYSCERRLRQGKALYYQGDEAEAAYRVKSGRIRLLRVHGGDSQVIGEAGTGSWLCLAEVCLGLPCLADALALGACELERFSRYNFHELLREPAFKDLVIGELARGSYLLHAAIGSGGADERVARSLVKACEEASGGSLKPGPPEEAGFVETGRGVVLVYDLEGLRDWAG